MAKTTQRVTEAADSFRPYVERAIQDEELRESVKKAVDSARSVYDELVGRKGVVPMANKVATDQDIQDNLKQTVEELRRAADRLRGKEDHSGRNTLFLFIGLVLGALFNPWTGPATRAWIKDTVFGGEEEFTYRGGGNSSPMSPPASSPTSEATTPSS
jgi:hypothetical protein